MSLLLKKTLTETFLARIKETPTRPAFQSKTATGWKTVTFREFHDQCRLVSFGFMGLKIQKGEKIAILAQTRYEWLLCDMAALGAGAVTVPVYPSNTSDDVEFILDHSEASIVVVENALQLEKVLKKRQEKPDSLASIRAIIVMEASAMSYSPKAPGSPRESKNILTLDALRELGRREEGNQPRRFEDHLRNAQPEDLVTICYTSGTTGTPKGAMITHDNIMSVLEDCVARIRGHIRPEHETVLSFLPCSHILGKLESVAIYTFGWKVAFAESIDDLPKNFKEIRPTLIFAVPRIFEKAYARIQNEVATRPEFLRKIFGLAVQAGKDFKRAKEDHYFPPIKEAAQYALARATLFSKVREGFGGRLKFAVCGGAPLAKEMGEFFDIIGIRILEGYGLTETSAPITLNSIENPIYGSVGKPLPEVTLRIAEDGEILVKSRKVFKGYYKATQETAEALENGWFHTGDIGVIDDDGILRITDRKKDLIITSAGKNIAPQKIEALAKSQKLISHLVAHGDRRNYLTALVTLDRQKAIEIATEHQILFSEYSELVKNGKMISIVQRLIDEINKTLPSYETVKKFVILADEFTVENGYLTPSLKVRRRLVEKTFKPQLDSMYAESRPRT